MKKNHMLVKVIICLLIIFSISSYSQTAERSSLLGKDRINNNQPIDINSKAEELGISAEQLSGILNSASSGSGEGDPLPDAMQEWFFTGQNAGDQFGMSVSTAGDVNGDGYDDIIVGSPYNDAITINAGRAYIYFGGNIIDNIPDVILIAELTDGNFGWAVSGAGDVNGDGYDDVIVGAPYTDFGGIDAGTFYVFFGGSPMNGQIDFFRDGYAAGDKMGISVSSAGDVNGDGYADLLAGATYSDAGGSESGSAYIFFGGTFIDIIADVIMTGAAAGDYFGAVSAAGDVNGDGFADVIVGAPRNDAGGTDAGRAYIYFGGSGMNNTADVILTGAAADDIFGASVSTAGDLNGDGYADVIVGANRNDVGGTDAGRAYIYYGGTNMNEIADVTLTGVAAGDNFGHSVSSASDVNGDGYSDVIVGARYNDAGGTDAGRAYIYFGGSIMDNVLDVILSGTAANDNYAFSVSTAGDVNGDGNSDVIIGAPFNDAVGTDAGRSYLYINSMTGFDIPDEFFTGAAAGDFFGRVSTAGDVNGDGYADVIVGAYSNDGGGTDAGRAYIYFSGPASDNIADVIMTGAAAGDAFGISVSTAGDVNGDGYSDVIIGASHNDAGGTDAGRAYIYFGGSSMNNSADVIMTGAAADDLFGNSVSTAGDVNRDGYVDVIVGAWFNDAGGNEAGRAYIYFGGSVMNNTADVVLTGEAESDGFGFSVSSAGDVNGDGYTDVIVGANYNDAGGINAGRVYIYFGGTSMNNNADVILTGTAAYDSFGNSVSTAGDVNGDGYSDVIIGADHNDAGGTEAGRAYIYFGESVMNNTADVILTGAAAYDYFGYLVSTVGDVNGDAYADVIVGVPGNDAGGTNAGRAYIYFGGSVMDNNADVILTGAAADDAFGVSVSTAGDVNGDGYADVIVGTNYNDAGGTDAGRAYLYLSSPPPIKPHIMSVKDVPLDQGGFVRVRWVRSGYDVVGQSRITNYILQRSDPPGPSGFVWDYVASIPALCENQYSYVAPTPYDSSLSSSGTFYFRVVANGTTPEERWYSNIISGHSVDNLAPLPPFNFYATLQTSQVKLGWKANTEPDFRNYHIYKSDTPVGSFNINQGLRESDSPDAFTLIGTTTDTTFIDTSPLAGNAYYYIQAYDVHDNGSPYSSDSIMAYLSANIRVFLEGAYVGGQMSTFINILGYIPLSQPFNTSPWNYTGTETVASIPANVTDWILVELRSTTTTVVDRRAAFIKNDGTLVDLDGVSNIKFPTAIAGDYYIVITHRNHLSVMTAAPVTISFNPSLYDMRTDLSKAFGTNAMKSLGGEYYGVYTADTDGSGTVNATDRSNTWNQRNLSGYYGTDIDLSGTVNAADRSSVWNNRNISTQVPTPVDRPASEIVKENNQ